jgi:FMN phosphatase YigB (HAD superfamily)
MIELICFDVFGTVFDMSTVPRDSIRKYVDHVKSNSWTPIDLSGWSDIKAHPDSKEGIDLLRTQFQVVTLSNGPMRLLTKISKLNNISWDAIIPIEAYYVYKPNEKAYKIACDLMGIPPEKTLMVTANPTFGDIEGAEKNKMQSQIIRQEGYPKTIIELYNTITRKN